jgi:hypothetical protein
MDEQRDDNTKSSRQARRRQKLLLGAASLCEAQANGNDSIFNLRWRGRRSCICFGAFPLRIAQRFNAGEFFPKNESRQGTKERFWSSMR